LFVPMLTVFPYIASLNNPNENVRMYMTMALVDEHTFTVDAEVGVFGWTNDMAKVPQPGGGTKYFSVKAPANSYLGVPVYAVFKRVAQAMGHPRPSLVSPPAERAWWLQHAIWWSRIVVVQLPCFAFLVAFERWLRAHVRSEGVRLAAVAALGLGTNYFGYSLMFVSHALEGAAMFGAFALAERELRRGGNRPRHTRVSAAFFTGALLGGIVLLEYQGLPTAVVLSLFAAYVFRRPKQLLAIAAGAGLNVAAMMWFQHCAYGNAFTPGHLMVEEQKFREWHHQGFFGLTFPDKETFGLLAMSPTFGFFGTSPFMLAGLLAVPLALLGKLKGGLSRPRALGVSFVWVASVLVLWLALSAAVNWRGGWTLGPRLLGGVSPFFAFGAALFLDRLARRGPKTADAVIGAGAGLALASVVTIGVPALVYNSIPETVTRPFLHFALPLARGGFVAHHVFEWFGFGGVRPWFLPLGCMLFAPVVALLAGPARGQGLLRWPAFVVALGLGLAPALSPGPLGDGREVGLDWFAKIWEPQGRDPLAKLAASNDDCRFVKSAAIYERMWLHQEAAAQLAVHRSRGKCQ